MNHAFLPIACLCVAWVPFGRDVCDGPLRDDRCGLARTARAAPRLDGPPRFDRRILARARASPLRGVPVQPGKRERGCITRPRRAPRAPCLSVAWISPASPMLRPGWTWHRSPRVRRHTRRMQPAGRAPVPCHPPRHGGASTARVNHPPAPIAWHSVALRAWYAPAVYHARALPHTRVQPARHAPRLCSAPAGHARTAPSYRARSVPLFWMSKAIGQKGRTLPGRGNHRGGARRPRARTAECFSLFMGAKWGEWRARVDSCGLKNGG